MNQLCGPGLTERQDKILDTNKSREDESLCMTDSVDMLNTKP